MGSLLTALASYLDMQQRGGIWCVRIDDLDPPRQDRAFIPSILNALAAHGLRGDEPVRYQSAGERRYEDALDRLSADLFHCDCTRKALAQLPRYPGTCRHQRQPRPNCAIRLNTKDAAFGDFIVRRRDGLWAYNFATAIDDGLDFNRIVRGADLEHVTTTQSHVIQRLGLMHPEYVHLPVLCYADGTKLSKQTGAPALDNEKALQNLRAALHYLGQSIPETRSVSETLRVAISAWRIERVPNPLAPYQPAS